MLIEYKKKLKKRIHIGGGRKGGIATFNYDVSVGNSMGRVLKRKGGG